MAKYTDQFVGYDANAYKNLKDAIISHRNKMTNKIKELNPVIASLKEHWKGTDADNYTKELQTVVNDASTETTTLYNGMDSNFAATYNDWVNKQNNK